MIIGKANQCHRNNCPSPIPFRLAVLSQSLKPILLILLLFPGLLQAQQDLNLLAHNIGFGGVGAGIGAVVNRKKGENWKRSFVRGFWQGCIGGAMNYTAKKTMHLIDKNDQAAYAIPARFLSSAGNSIIQNAANNGPFLKNWHFEYTFMRVDFQLGTEHRIRLRLLPSALLSTAIVASKGQFDASATLLTGVIIFKSNRLINSLHGAHDGISYGRAFVYTDDSLKYHLISHELIHEFQLREFMFCNSYLNPVYKNLKPTGTKRFLEKYVYPDIPYFGLFYMIEGVHPDNEHFRNYFEFEAERFATNKDVLIK